MPNIASVLKEEIIRLTRKEFRQQIEPLRAQLLAQRKTIAALKQDIDKLRRDSGKAAKAARNPKQVEADANQDGKRSRYSGALLRKLRERLGLSREAFAPLLGASPQALYNWEQTDTRPRQEFLDKISLVRALSKAQVSELLEQHSAPKPRKTAKKVAKKKTARAKAA